MKTNVRKKYSEAAEGQGQLFLVSRAFSSNKLGKILGNVWLPFIYEDIYISINRILKAFQEYKFWRKRFQGNVHFREWSWAELRLAAGGCWLAGSQPIRGWDEESPWTWLGSPRRPHSAPCCFTPVLMLCQVRNNLLFWFFEFFNWNYFDKLRVKSET